MGVMGAAIATCISYISVFIYRALDICKYTKIKYFDPEKSFYILTLSLAAVSIYLEVFVISLIVYMFTFIVAVDFIKHYIKLHKNKR